MRGAHIDLDKAIDLTRTGDVWLFRGRSAADRAIQVTHQQPRQPRRHVGRPRRHAAADVARGARPVADRHVDAAPGIAACSCTTCARPCWCGDASTASTAGCASSSRRSPARWKTLSSRRSRDSTARRSRRRHGSPRGGSAAGCRCADAAPTRTVGSDGSADSATSSRRRRRTGRTPRDGLLRRGRRRHLRGDGPARDRPPPGWYDPGRFWSGDELDLLRGASLGGEIAVNLPP